MADIYDIDFAFQNRNLISPNHRTTKTLELCEAITDALQDLRDLVFDDFKTGSSYAAYNNATSYALYDRVTWTDMGVYELQVASSTGVDPTGEALSATNWRKVLDYYIGSDERRAFRGQLIVFGYAINKWFGVTAAPYIYFEPLYNPAIAIRIHFPVAVHTALGSSAANRGERIDQFISRYMPAGTAYDVVTY